MFHMLATENIGYIFRVNEKKQLRVPAGKPGYTLSQTGTIAPCNLVNDTLYGKTNKKN